jgi:hypothetical protein
MPERSPRQRALRWLALTALLLALTVTHCAAKEQSLAELKLRFANAPPEEQPQLAIQIAQRDLRTADELYQNGKVDDARANVDELVSYCEKARDAALRTKKRIKNVEIDTRKIADKLRDVDRTLSFDDQPPVEQAIRRLEDIRTALLQEMFAKDEKKEEKKKEKP